MDDADFDDDLLLAFSLVETIADENTPENVAVALGDGGEDGKICNSEASALDKVKNATSSPPSISPIDCHSYSHISSSPIVLPSDPFPEFSKKITSLSSQARENDETEEFTGLRIENRSLNGKDVREALMGRMVYNIRDLALKAVPSSVVAGKVSKDGAPWVTIGILAEKSAPKSSKSESGGNYSAWTLTDFRANVTLFLFGEAYQEYWKTLVGSIILVSSPVVLPASEKKSFCLSVTRPDQLLRLGQSPDIANCQGLRKDGTRCTMKVNKNIVPYCQYHMKQEYARESANRGNLLGSRNTALFKPAPNATNISAGRYTNESLRYFNSMAAGKALPPTFSSNPHRKFPQSRVSQALFNGGGESYGYPTVSTDSHPQTMNSTQPPPSISRPRQSVSSTLPLDATGSLVARQPGPPIQTGVASTARAASSQSIARKPLVPGSTAGLNGFGHIGDGNPNVRRASNSLASQRLLASHLPKNIPSRPIPLNATISTNGKDPLNAKPAITSSLSSTQQTMQVGKSNNPSINKKDKPLTSIVINSQGDVVPVQRTGNKNRSVNGDLRADAISRLADEAAQKALAGDSDQGLAAACVVSRARLSQALEEAHERTTGNRQPSAGARYASAILNTSSQKQIQKSSEDSFLKSVFPTIFSGTEVAKSKSSTVTDSDSEAELEILPMETSNAKPGAKRVRTSSEASTPKQLAAIKIQHSTTSVVTSMPPPASPFSTPTTKARNASQCEKIFNTYTSMSKQGNSPTVGISRTPPVPMIEKADASATVSPFLPVKMITHPHELDVLQRLEATEKIKGEVKARLEMAREKGINLLPTVPSKPSVESRTSALPQIAVSRAPGLPSLASANTIEAISLKRTPQSVELKTKPMANTFGIDKTLSIFSARSIHEEQAYQEQLEKVHDDMGRLEKLEFMQEKLAEQQSRKVTRWACGQCEKVYEKKPSICIEEGHELKPVTRTEWAFSCDNCKRKIYHPSDTCRIACPNCDKRSWSKTSVHNLPPTSTSANPKVLVRGHEHGRFLGQMVRDE